MLEVLFIKLPKLPETKLAEVREEYLALLLHLILHVHHLLLFGGDAQGVQGNCQVLHETSLSCFQTVLLQLIAVLSEG